MPRTNITEFSNVASENTDINSVNIAENCPASGINNALRELMKALKDVDTGSQALTALSVTGALSCGAFTSNGIDDNADAVALTIDSSERIGIGTTSPSEKLEINSGTGNIGAKIVSTDSLALIAYKDNSTSDVVLSGASGDNFAVSHDILFTNSSKGIYLGVTSATASNLLSDYEEGTFVPNFAFGGGTSGQSYAEQVGFYTKVGRMVYFTLRLQLSARGSSTGAITIQNLPFTTLNTSISESGAYVSFVNNLSSNFDTNNLTLVLTVNATEIKVRRVNSGASGEFAHSDFGNSSQMIVSGTYMTS